MTIVRWLAFVALGSALVFGGCVLLFNFARMR